MKIKKIYKKLTSKEAKEKYKKVGTALKNIGEKSSRYLQTTNTALDDVLGNNQYIRIPRGYKLVKKKKRRY